jgi:dihydrofolate reductase
MKLCLIVAVSNNGVIGKAGDIPWKLSEDLRYFRALTTGHAVVEGRKTLESIGRALPNRTNFVVCGQDPGVAGVIHATSLEQAKNLAEDLLHEKLFVIGGERLYKEARELVSDMYITRVNFDVDDGDAFFDEVVDPAVWALASQSPTQGQFPITFNFEHYTRRT